MAATLSPRAKKILSPNKMDELTEDKILATNVCVDFMHEAYSKSFLSRLTLTRINFTQGDWFTFRFEKDRGTSMSMKISKDLTAFTNIQGTSSKNRISKIHRPMIGSFRALADKGIIVKSAKLEINPPLENSKEESLAP